MLMDRHSAQEQSQERASADSRKLASTVANRSPNLVEPEMFHVGASLPDILQ